MRTQQLEAALTLARSSVRLNIDDLAQFDGFALPDFRPVTCTLEALAMLVRWQCVCFDGSVDSEALQEIATVGRHRFTVLDSRKAVA
jgi:hypothetical protein